MDKKVKSALNAVIALLLLGSTMLSITCCNGSIHWESNNQQKEKVISPDSPWFEGNIVDVDLGIDNQRPVMDLFPKLAGADNKYIVVFSDGTYRVNDWSQVKTNADFAIKSVTVIERETKKNYKTINLYSLLNPIDWPNAVIYTDGQLIVKSESWESTTDKYFNRDYIIDIESERIIETYDYEYSEDIKYSGSYRIGSYRLDAFFYCGKGKKYCPVKIYSHDGNVKDVEISNINKDIFEIVTVLSLDKTQALIIATSDREYKYFKLDLNTFEYVEVNAKEYEWIDSRQLLHSFNSSDNNVFCSTQYGVSMINLRDRNVEQVFDCSCCEVNRNYLSDLEIADCSKDKLLLCGQYGTSDMYSSRYIKKYVVVEFNRAVKNPHAGKKIIELYLADGQITETIADAILRYNNSNHNFYIEITNRYKSIDSIGYSDVGNLDDYDTARYVSNAKLSDELAMDIINGTGPDILMNTSSLGVLNNPTYLVDLAAYTSQLDSDKYYKNILDGATIDNSIYQLPISFTIEGIQTDPAYAGKTGVGFTTEEYKKFLYTTLNGRDVIESGQTVYLTKLFNGMYNEFIKEGKCSFTDSKYTEISNFVNDNVRQNSQSWKTITETSGSTSDDSLSDVERIAYYCNCPGISGYLVKRSQIENGSAILGIPSTDGRGPMVGTKISVAISKHTDDVEACIEFVKILLSDEIQEQLVMCDSFVINREAFKRGCNAAIDYFNSEEGSQNLYDYSAGTYVNSNMKYTTDDINNLEKIVLSCSRVSSVDSTINMILVEEMPAFFLGQKDLYSVEIIIQDRVQKVLDERG